MIRMTGRHQTGGALFLDRQMAGEQLASALAAYRAQATVVFAIPRGGVPVAVAVAQYLAAELDIVVARKIGAPRQPELALGAITADGSRVLNAALIEALGVTERYLAAETAAQIAVARRRERQLCGGLPRYSPAGRCAIVVDDGLATGATMRAAVAVVRRQNPARLVAAVPVGARESCTDLRTEVDELVCLYEPEQFWAVGRYYQHFAPVEDDEVRQLLRAYAATHHTARTLAE